MNIEKGADKVVKTLRVMLTYAPLLYYCLALFSANLYH